MRIGILTYYRVPNFGANLQAISTYYCLKKLGHEIVFLNYASPRTRFIQRRVSGNRQFQAHFDFIDKYIPEQTKVLSNSSAVKNEISRRQLDAVIIGSDAVTQHHPLFSTLKLSNLSLYWLMPLEPERRFPNAFWGYRFAGQTPTAMMSVSSQNSPYKSFSMITNHFMGKLLGKMRYISTRDEWTRDMMLNANDSLQIEITPDPVFALNENAKDIIPTEEEIRSKFNLPEKYVLVGLRSQALTLEQMSEFDRLLRRDNMSCVSFPVDIVKMYKHPFKYSIDEPISPLEWFALLKYASAYVGSNMHPIVSCLTNGVPCYSLDNWGTTDFWGRKKESASSKVYDVLHQYGLEDNRSQIEQGKCQVKMEHIIDTLHAFPKDKVMMISRKRYEAYRKMIDDIINSLK